MQILLTLLRLIHILAAFAWIALGGVQTVYLLPAISRAGANGLYFLKSLVVNTSITKVFPMVAGTATLMGLLLYLVGGSTSHFTTLGNIVLGIGAVAGLAAAIHGGAVTGRATTALNKALVQYVPDSGQAISPEGMTAVNQSLEALLADSRVSLALSVVALIGMASARYL